MGETFDAVVVGARCAGAPLAMLLARAGRRVLLVDRDEFPSDSISTHLIFPNTLARLEELGIMERLRKEHHLPLVLHRLSILGHDVRGPFTPVGGYDRALCLRRLTLDHVFVEAALDAGAVLRLGVKVRSLAGSGREGDPVRGVVLEGGKEVAARWVFGADGRASTVARALGLREQQPMTGEMAVLYAYWNGLPAQEFTHLDVIGREALGYAPVEDGATLAVYNGDPGVTSGGRDARERAYEEGIRRFPDTIDPEAFDEAERFTPVFAAPETMMRGFYKQANGPGWALVGDAGHYKHPATAQGISDAIEQAVFLAGALTGDDPELRTYQPWRDERAAGHYEHSFQWARWPVPEVAGKLFGGFATDPEAAQDLRDSFSRLRRPGEVYTQERLERWFAS